MEDGRRAVEELALDECVVDNSPGNPRAERVVSRTRIRKVSLRLEYH